MCLILGQPNVLFRVGKFLFAPQLVLTANSFYTTSTMLGLVDFKELLKELFWELAKVSTQELSEFSKGTDEEAATHSPVAELEHKPKNEKILEPISKKHQNSLTGWVLKISLKLNQ